MVYRFNALLSSLFGYKQQEEPPASTATMSETTEEAPVATQFKFTVEDTFGDEVSIKSPMNAMPKYHNKRRNSKRFVIGDESDDIEATPEVETLPVPNPEWLQQSALLKPGTTLT